MKIKIKRDALLAGLAAVQNVISTNTTLPIASNVLLKAEKGRLDLTATDLDVTVSCSVEAEVEKPGATTSPVRRLFGIVKEMDGAEVELETDDENHVTEVRCGYSVYHVNGLGPDEFPPEPGRNGAANKAVITQAGLKLMLSRTSYAISTDTARAMLTGLSFEVKGGKVITAATDGKRLALANDDTDSKAKDGSVVVPSKAIEEVARLLKEAGKVEVSFSENHARFDLTNEDGKAEASVVTKLMDGTYPNYRQVIPAECKERVALPREQLLKALRRAQFMTTDKYSGIKVTLKKNALVITVNAPDAGDARETLEVKYAGKEVEIAFNPKYVIEPLAALTDDEVFLELTDGLSPAVLKVNGPFLYVAMPLRLS